MRVRFAGFECNGQHERVNETIFSAGRNVRETIAGQPPRMSMEGTMLVQALNLIYRLAMQARLAEIQQVRQ